MTQPGAWLLALARWCCSTVTRERLIEPIVSDFRVELASSICEPRLTRSWIATRLRRVPESHFSTCSAIHCRPGLGRAAPDDGVANRTRTVHTAHRTIVVVLLTAVSAANLPAPAGAPQ